MLSDNIRNHLETLAAELVAADDALAQLTSQRDDAIREQLAAGTSATLLGQIFGLGRQRVYQIRDRRR